jgi:acetoin utilization protein AcuB
MLASQILETGLPALSVSDKVEFALQQMEDYEVFHLPVTSNDKFAGLIGKDELLEADESAVLGALQSSIIQTSVFPDDHIISILKCISRYEVSVVPVVTKTGELAGVVTEGKLLKQLSVFLNADEPGGMLVIEMDKRNFSFGELSRLIETNDAYITQLNTFTEASGNFIVTIKINKSEISDILATLQRYDYNIRYYFGEEDYENELKENYDLLMTYLNI